MAKRGTKNQVLEWEEPDNILLVQGWARDGLTEKQIAYNMGIAYSTLKRWKKISEPLSAAIKEKKEIVDREVENALYKRAMGYEYEEVKKIQVKKADGTEEKRVEKTVKKVAPDVTAQIFWLKNRKPAVWRDKQDQVVTHIEDLTPLVDMINAEDTDN